MIREHTRTKRKVKMFRSCPTEKQRTRLASSRARLLNFAKCRANLDPVRTTENTLSIRLGTTNKMRNSHVVGSSIPRHQNSSGHTMRQRQQVRSTVKRSAPGKGDGRSTEDKKERGSERRAGGLDNGSVEVISENKDGADSIPRTKREELRNI